MLESLMNCLKHRKTPATGKSTLYEAIEKLVNSFKLRFITTGKYSHAITNLKPTSTPGSIISHCMPGHSITNFRPILQIPPLVPAYAKTSCKPLQLPPLKYSHNIGPYYNIWS